MPLTLEIQDAILWPSFIFIFQSCCLSLMRVVNPVNRWTCSNSAQISDASLAVICANWSHSTASCSSAWASWFFLVPCLHSIGWPSRSQHPTKCDITELLTYEYGLHQYFPDFIIFIIQLHHGLVRHGGNDK